ncbi:glycosyltransferase family 2 protein [Conexibacter sp. SYSU D00693]|uniref:GspE/PulE/PilB domain-containing protein n=1 Tax=Conexibacter sp. SYSU D00693 TaxID=2812560 RepID=UPI00196A3C14|nr:glycosyltransferase [Conexibacter sp. SYSU D00693]
MSATEASRAFYRRLADHAGLPFVVLDPADAGAPDHQAVNPLAARLLGPEVCRQYLMLPVAYVDGVVTVATAAPADDLSREVAASLTGRPVRFVVAAEDELLAAIDRLFGAAPTDAGAAAAVPSASHPTLPPRRAAAAESAEEEAAFEDEQPDDRGPVTDPSFPTRLGDLLVARGVATDEDVAAALEEQARTGSRLGDVLMAKGVVSEPELVAILAEHFQLPLVDLSEYDPDPAALELVPEPLARTLRAVPLAVDDTTLYLAIADVLDDQTVAALREHTHLELRGFLASRNSIDELLQRIYGEEYVAVAKSELLTRFPEDSANQVVTPAQRAVLVVGAVLLVAALILFPVPTLIGLIGASSIFYTATSVYKFVLTYRALGHQYEIDVTPEEVAALDERELPVYTILVPLYQEAAVLPKLTKGIEGLDYPKTKLDVRLLCEEDDPETPAAIREMDLPPHFKLVVVPDAQPKTKPKACNYGLLQADGEYVVIFDAEDIPDRDQLKKVVIAFRKADPRVTCIQAKLNYFNADQNLLTRWFTTEYSMWFDLMLPGLDASGVPIPLGGTSNHFITDRLIELAAWDPFNVTEDADLGIRLHKAGYKTAMVDSTTLEEANSVLDNWIRQRSRWIKGYLQTWLVHMRNPARLLRQIGLKSFISFQLIVGGTFIFLLNPIFWGLTTLFFFSNAGFIEELFPSFVFYAAAFQLFIGNFVFMYLNVAGSVQRGYFDLAKYALLSPLYWGLMSIAAWKGFGQLVTKPFYWEKTIHGLDDPHAAPIQPQRVEA